MQIFYKGPPLFAIALSSYDSPQNCSFKVHPSSAEVHRKQWKAIEWGPINETSGKLEMEKSDRLIF